MECFGLSIITNVGDADNIETVYLDVILETAKKAEHEVRSLIKELNLNH